jgi:hypothetical protein
VQSCAAGVFKENAMTDNNVVEFTPKGACAEPSNESEMILQTLANVMDFQEKLEKGMKLASAVITEMQEHVRVLERDVTELQKRLPKKPAIYNAQGSRAN